MSTSHDVEGDDNSEIGEDQPLKRRRRGRPPRNAAPESASPSVIDLLQQSETCPHCKSRVLGRMTKQQRWHHLAQCAAQQQVSSDPASFQDRRPTLQFLETFQTDPVAAEYRFYEGSGFDVLHQVMCVMYLIGFSLFGWCLYSSVTDWVVVWVVSVWVVSVFGVTDWVFTNDRQGFGDVDEQLAHMARECQPIDTDIKDRCILEFATQMNEHGHLSGCAACGVTVKLPAGETRFTVQPVRNLRTLEASALTVAKFLGTSQSYRRAYNLVGFNADCTEKTQDAFSTLYHLHSKFVVQASSGSFKLSCVVSDNEFVAILCAQCCIDLGKKTPPPLSLAAGYDFGLPFQPGLGLAPLSKCAKLLISRYRCSQQVVKLSVVKSGHHSGYASRGHAIGIAHEGRKALNADCLPFLTLSEDTFTCFLIGEFILFEFADDVSLIGFFFGSLIVSLNGALVVSLIGFFL